ncbi:MAG: hypothetical protein O3A01_01685 [bacterium]|nr:hypothetical protein [bacterium]
MWILLWIAIGIRSAMDLSFKSAVHHLHFDGIDSFVPNFIKLLRMPIYWFANVVALVSMGLWVLVLSQFDLSYAYPLFSICYVVIIIMGRFLFQEHLDKYKIIGISLIALSSIVLALSH